jgi:glycosyltransferase involved in cell wall biosynthesis
MAENPTITVLSDPLVNDYGSARPALLVAEALARKAPVDLVALRISPRLQTRLKESGVRPMDLGVPAPPGSQSVGYLLDWMITPLHSARVADLVPSGPNVLNFSNTLISPCAAWFAQGTIAQTLEGIFPSLEVHHKIAAKFSLPLVRLLERGYLGRFIAASRLVVANSGFDRDIYRTIGIRVDGVIPPPVDTQRYAPSTDSPSRDYVLAYIGKETDLEALYAVAKQGIPIRAFGAKLESALRYLRGLPQVQLLGHLTEEELVEAYSNARFTLFPFTAEPFGYVPVESMACGTPVLTYGSQGPSETVRDGSTGWLAGTREELVAQAKRLWEEGAPSARMSADCVEVAKEFDTLRVADRWVGLLAEPHPYASWSKLPAPRAALRGHTVLPSEGHVSRPGPGIG